MEKVLRIKDQVIEFRFIEHADCWQTEAIIDGIKTEIVIDFEFHKEKEVDWQHFEKFFHFINEKEGRFIQLIDDSQKLVSEMGTAFFRSCQDEVSDWKMEFSNSILFNGKKMRGQVADDGTYTYALTFAYFVQKGDRIYGDESGLYLVDIENLAIVGTRRC